MTHRYSIFLALACSISLTACGPTPPSNEEAAKKYANFLTEQTYRLGVLRVEAEASNGRIDDAGNAIFDMKAYVVRTEKPAPDNLKEYSIMRGSAAVTQAMKYADHEPGRVKEGNPIRVVFERADNSWHIKNVLSAKDSSDE